VRVHPGQGPALSGPQARADCKATAENPEEARRRLYPTALARAQPLLHREGGMGRHEQYPHAALLEIS